MGLRRRDADEGVALRRSGIDRPILVASPLTAPEHRAVPRRRSPTRHRRSRRAPRLARALRSSVSSGDRHRNGREQGSAGTTTPSLGRGCGGLLEPAPGWEGVFTHFHSADSDPASIECQWRRFEAALRGAAAPADRWSTRPTARRRSGDGSTRRTWPGPESFCTAAPPEASRPGPSPTLRARVLAVRELAAGETVSYGATWRAPAKVTVATLGIGYADGFPRATDVTGSRRRVGRAARSRPFPSVGRVTMDMTMVDGGRAGRDWRCGDGVRRNRLPRLTGPRPPARSPTSC